MLNKRHKINFVVLEAYVVILLVFAWCYFFQSHLSYSCFGQRSCLLVVSSLWYTWFVCLHTSKRLVRTLITKPMQYQYIGLNNIDHNPNVGERPNILSTGFTLLGKGTICITMRLGVRWDGTLQSRVGQTVHNISHLPAFKKHIYPQNHAKYETIFNYGLFNDAVSCSYTKRRMVRRLAKNERKRIG